MAQTFSSTPYVVTISPLLATLIILCMYHPAGWILLLIAFVPVVIISGLLMLFMRRRPFVNARVWDVTIKSTLACIALYMIGGVIFAATRQDSGDAAVWIFAMLFLMIPVIFMTTYAIAALILLAGSLAPRR